MSDILSVYVWPFIAAVLSYILCLYVISRRRLVFDFDKNRFFKPVYAKLQGKKKEKDMSFILVLTAASLFAQEILILIIETIVRRLANTYLITAAPVSPVIYAAFALTFDAGLVYLVIGKNPKVTKALKKVMIAAPVFLILETLAFNLGSFSGNQEHKNIDLYASYYETADYLTAPEYSDKGIVLTGDASLIFDDLPDYTRVVNISFAREDVDNPLGLFAQIAMKDNNTGAAYGVADTKAFSGYRDVKLFIRPFERLYSTELYISGVTDPVTITSVTAFNTDPYHADSVRYVAALLLTAAVVFILEFKLSSVYFDSKKQSHVTALVLCVIFTVVSTFLVYKTDEFELIDYPFYDNTAVDDIYALKFDAMKKGLPYLDLPPEADLEGINNLYDYTERSAAEVYYRWDYAYRDGHYYCYFGSTPVLLFYYPLEMFTGKVPSYNLALGLSGTLAAAGITLAYIAISQRYTPRKKLLPYLLSVPVVCISSMLFYSLIYPMKYYLPALCALAGLGFAVFLGLTAVSEKNTRKSGVLFALSGICLAFCAGARPVTAMGAAVLLPAFMGVLADKKLTARDKLIKAAVFAGPVIFGIIKILSYNNFRFGDPFDFGENYQLTISNISSLKIDIDLLPVSVFYFFFQPYEMSATFPFFRMIAFPLNNYEIFRNIELNVGVMNIPFFLAGLLLVWGTMSRFKKGMPGKRLEYNAYVLVTIAISVIIAWFDFCRGGTAVRYTADFAGILAMMSAVALIRRLMMPSGRKALYGVIMAALVITPVLIIMSYLPVYNSNLQYIYPQLLERAEDFFLFWR